MVPTIVFPPATPLTVQASVGREPSLVFAVNCCVVRPGRVALGGVTMTEKPCEPPPGIIASAHPPRKTTKIDSRINAERFTAALPFSAAARNFAGKYTGPSDADRKADNAVGLVGEGYGG